MSNAHRREDWMRGQRYGIVRAAAEAKIAGHDDLHDQLHRMALKDLDERPATIAEGDWDLDDAPTPPAAPEKP